MKRFLKILAAASGVFGAVAFAAWLTGRLLTDRTLPTQFIWWVPAWVFVAALAAALGLRTICQRILVRTENRSPKVSCLLAASLIAVTVHAAFFEYRLASTTARTKEPGPPALRLLVWNPAGQPTLAEPLIRGNPDLIAVVNSGYGAEWPAVMEALGDRASAVRSGRMVIASRFHILEWGAGSLKVKGAKERTFTWHGGQKVHIDEGYAAYCIMECPQAATGRLTLWFLDLPSDPDIHRARMMTEAGAAIEAFRGPRYARSEAGDRDEVIPAGSVPQGFPPADLIVGDFNTPRGSHSLQTVCPEFTHAYRQAGKGFMPTWPRNRPLIAIDHVFLSPQWQATKYATLDLAVGEHLAQWCEFRTVKGQ